MPNDLSARTTYAERAKKKKEAKELRVKARKDKEKATKDIKLMAKKLRRWFAEGKGGQQRFIDLAAEVEVLKEARKGLMDTTSECRRINKAVNRTTHKSKYGKAQIMAAAGLI